MLLQPTWPPSHLLHVAVERRVLYMEGPNGREPVVRHIKQDAEIGPFHSSRLLALNVLIARNRWYDAQEALACCQSRPVQDAGTITFVPVLSEMR